MRAASQSTVVLGPEYAHICEENSAEERRKAAFLLFRVCPPRTGASISLSDELVIDLVFGLC